MKRNEVVALLEKQNPDIIEKMKECYSELDKFTDQHTDYSKFMIALNILRDSLLKNDASFLTKRFNRHSGNIFETLNLTEQEKNIILKAYLFEQLHSQLNEEIV